MRFGLRTQLFGVTLGLLVLLTLGALGAVYYYIGQQVHQQAERKLRAGAHVLTSILDRTKEQLLGRGQILTESRRSSAEGRASERRISMSRQQSRCATCDSPAAASITAFISPRV